MMESELPKKRVGYCRNAARNLLEKYSRKAGKLTPPIPVWQVAETEGFMVHLLDSLPEKHSAIVIHDQKLIGINKKHHPRRQRFSLGHELGHICLGHRPETELSDEENRVCNAEANEFAAEVLVPFDLLKKELQKTADVDQLAEIFDVSREVITRKIISQNLLSRI